MLQRIILSSVLACGIVTAQTPAPTIRVDGNQIFRDLDVLAGETMEGRLAGSAGGDRARAYVVRRFGESGVEPFAGSFERPFTFSSRNSGERKGTNVIGRIRGASHPDRYIVVTAHYDHVGVRNGQVFNGADDNASGVAALLALAAHFKASTPENSILVAALDAEEEGLQGARALMREPPVPVTAMVVNVNMDMIGRDPANKLFAVGTYHWPNLKPYLQHVAQPPVVLAFGHDAPGEKEDWTRDSDHYVFHDAGIPFVYFGVEDFDQHHKATDDAGTIGKEFLAGAAATVIAAVREFDWNLDRIADSTKARK